MIFKSIKDGLCKYFSQIVITATFTLCGTIFLKGTKIYNAITQQHVKTNYDQAKDDATDQIIDDQLVKCDTNGLFIGVWRIENNNDEFTVKNHHLRGLWHKNKVPENTRFSNPTLYLKNLKIDKNTQTLFLNALSTNSYVFVNERIAKQNNYKVLIYIFENLDLKKEGVTLEGIYLKPETKERLIWIFSMSFVKLKNGKCYNLQNEKVAHYALQNVVDGVKMVNYIK